MLIGTEMRFGMVGEKMTVYANKKELAKVQGFIDSILKKYDFPIKTVIQIDIAVEELFVNIASYAYQNMQVSEQDQVAIITCKVENDRAEITLADFGKAFNPLDRNNPDVTLAAEERDIGGLGIYMVRKSMDGLAYERKENQNILRICKNR